MFFSDMINVLKHYIQFFIQTESPFAALGWKKDGQTLRGDTASNKFGTSVCISADAKTLVVGAPGYLGNGDKSGYVEVYYRKDRDESIWEKVGQTIYGKAAGDLFGTSVDVNANGTIFAIGAPGSLMEGSDRPGYVRVYRLESGTSIWKQLGKEISDGEEGGKFGVSVSSSNKNKTLAVGAWFVNNYSGCVKIFHMADTSSIWKQVGQDIDGESFNDSSGCSLSLSADGDIIAIGLPHNSDNGANSGHVRVYKIDNDSWENLGNTIQGDSAKDHFGWSVDISDDGRILAIGAPNREYVRVYRMEGNNSWKQLGTKISAEGFFAAEFGTSVSLSFDGMILAIGAPGVNGAVRIHQLNDTDFSWMMVGDDIDGDTAYEESGFSVSLSGDGKSVVIGSYRNDDNGHDSGYVRVFSWTSR
jgi:hypothetical protein